MLTEQAGADMPISSRFRSDIEQPSRLFAGRTLVISALQQRGSNQIPRVLT
jgi:hypothetical protein